MTCRFGRCGLPVGSWEPDARGQTNRDNREDDGLSKVVPVLKAQLDGCLPCQPRIGMGKEAQFGNKFAVLSSQPEQLAGFPKLPTSAILVLTEHDPGSIVFLK
jgi:hypothetical protein